jgi:sulfide:quinone oxidoreductase
MTRVVIAGAGVAALEAALALHDLAADQVDLTLVAPERRFVYRPLSVGEPFALGEPRSVPLDAIARDLGAELRRDSLTSVDVDAHRALFASNGSLDYDVLLVAVGARRVAAYTHAIAFRGPEDSEAVHGLIQDLEGGYVSRIAFVVPPGVAWPLPIYELALMAAERAAAMSRSDVELTVVTPEPEPLAAFGHEASAAVRRRLEDAGVKLETSVSAQIPDARTVILRPERRLLGCDRVVALAETDPVAIGGLARDPRGFLPVDRHGRVIGAPDVYAAGDGTDFPVKQGGIACQQGDAAAESIARDAGTVLEPRPFRPVLRGELLTGGRPLYLRTVLQDNGNGSSESSGHTLWWPPVKIAGDYLAPYLAERERTAPTARVAPPARRVARIAHPLSEGHGIELLGFDFESDTATAASRPSST